MGKGIFITGTDTGVGKTYVAAGLIRALSERGASVCPMKPVETGCRVKDGKLVPRDALKMLKASGADEPLDAVSPFRMRSPLAPSVASMIEGIPIDRKRIVSLYKQLKKRYDVTVVEGAGGIMVPVCGSYLFLHLIRDMDIPLVIVARPGLGTINHSLLTLASAAGAHISVLGVVINYAVEGRRGLAEKTNPGVVENLGRVPVLGTVPHRKNARDRKHGRIFSEIAEKILSRL